MAGEAILPRDKHQWISWELPGRIIHYCNKCHVRRTAENDGSECDYPTYSEREEEWNDDNS